MTRIYDVMQHTAHAYSSIVSLAAAIMGRRKRKVEQVENKIGYWTSKRAGHDGEFVELTNFGLRMLKFVQAPCEFPEYSGFVVEVTQELKRRTAKG